MTVEQELSNKYEIREQIGKGAFGSVFLALDKATSKKYVLKRIRLARQTKWQRKHTLQEMKMVASLKYPFIVPEVDSWIDSGHTVNIVYGYCEKGDLGSHVQKAKANFFPESQLRLWLAEMLLALDYLESQKVVHRDIKTSNCFLTKAGDLQLGDFGLATYRNTDGDEERPEDHALVGTPHFMSPELLSRLGYTFKTDIWSLGCVFHELSTLKPTFDAFDVKGLITRIRTKGPGPLPGHYSVEWANIIKRMLRKDPNKRPSAAELMALPQLREDVLLARQRAVALMMDVRLPRYECPGGCAEGDMISDTSSASGQTAFGDPPRTPEPHLVGVKSLSPPAERRQTLRGSKSSEKSTTMPKDVIKPPSRRASSKRAACPTGQDALPHQANAKAKVPVSVVPLVSRTPGGKPCPAVPQAKPHRATPTTKVTNTTKGGTKRGADVDINAAAATKKVLTPPLSSWKREVTKPPLYKPSAGAKARGTDCRKAEANVGMARCPSLCPSSSSKSSAPSSTRRESCRTLTGVTTGGGSSARTSRNSSTPSCATETECVVEPAVPPISNVPDLLDNICKQLMEQNGLPSLGKLLRERPSPLKVEEPAPCLPPPMLAPCATCEDMASPRDQGDTSSTLSLSGSDAGVITVLEPIPLPGGFTAMYQSPPSSALLQPSSNPLFSVETREQRLERVIALAVELFDQQRFEELGAVLKGALPSQAAQTRTAKALGS